MGRFEDYSIGETLATGGEGKVFLCKKLKNGERVGDDMILKLIPAVSPDSLTHSLNECKMVFSLESDYFVQYLDYFIHTTEDELSFCIVMPKYSMDLATYIKKTTVPAHIAAKFCLDVITALE